MDRWLVVVGVQSEKVKTISGGDKIVKWIQTHAAQYNGVMAVVRKDQGNRNFIQSGDKIANKLISHLEYPADTIIEVGGYDLDCRQFRKDIEYDIIGISTGASVMCTAMSMYSYGLKINIIESLCKDRKGLHKEAIKLMNAYMPGCVK